MNISEWVKQYRSDPVRLLIVDDTDGIAEIIKTALRGYDCECVSVSDGASAVQAVSQCKFDLIFLDLNLPKIDGVEVLKHIKTVSPDTPVVIMTGFAESTLLEEASRLGVISLLHKPLDFRAETIRQAFQTFKLCGSPLVNPAFAAN